MRAGFRSDIDALLLRISYQSNGIAACQMQNMQMGSQCFGEKNAGFDNRHFRYRWARAQHSRIAFITRSFDLFRQHLDQVEVFRMNSDQLASFSDFTEDLIDFTLIQRRNDVFHAFLIVINQLIGFTVDGITPEIFKTAYSGFGKRKNLIQIQVAEA